MTVPRQQRMQSRVGAIDQAHPHLPTFLTLSGLRQHTATALGRWATGPRRSHNLHALCYVATVAGLAIGLTWTMADRTTVLRLITVVLFAAHVAANNLIVTALTALRNRGVPEAGRALDAYLGPGRITSTEIGAIWIGLGLFAPLLDLIVPAVAG